MTAYRFSNNDTTTLGSAISPTATTITVASGTGVQFPSPGAGQYFTATLFASATGLPNEIVLVTSRTGDTMTVIRGQEGTTAQSWSVGDAFANFITAGFLNSLADAGAIQTQSGNYANDTGTANAGAANIVPAPANLGALIGVPLRIHKSGASNTGPYTLNVNTFGNVNVLLGGQALEGGELTGASTYEVVFDGTSFDLLSPPAVIHGNIIAGDSIPNAALVEMAALTVKGNMGGGIAEPYDVPLLTLAEAMGYAASTMVAASGKLMFPLIVGGNLVTGFIQFGSGSVNSGTDITFDEEFPTACVFVLASDSGYGEVSWGTDKASWSRTGFNLNNNLNSTGAYVYIAIGY